MSALAPVDLVFTYVDGADPAHRAKRRAHGGAGEPTADGSGEGAYPQRERWYLGVGEITFSVRSVLRWLPWIRTIHVVTDAQRPPVDPELISSGRVRVVDHAEIVPDRYRPVFASTIIESCLHRIPGLSDVWLYDNDDYMHFAPVPPETFVQAGPGGGAALSLKAYRARVRDLLRAASGVMPGFVPHANPYTMGISNAFRVLRRRARVPRGEILVPRHATQVYRKATAERLEEEFADVLHHNRELRFRSHAQVSYSTLAYTMERQWHREDRVRLWTPLAPDPDIRVYDFLHCRRPGGCERKWRAVQASDARLACLNNVPLFERDRFLETMRLKGLGEPLA